MKILVMGSRYWTNRKRIYAVFQELPPTTIVVHGAQGKYRMGQLVEGADMMANEVARDLGFETRLYPADWSKYGNAAGPIRNQKMLQEEHPDKDGVYIDSCFAFHDDLEGSRGSLDMAKRAINLSLSVNVFTQDTAYTFRPSLGKVRP